MNHHLKGQRLICQEVTKSEILIIKPTHENKTNRKKKNITSTVMCIDFNWELFENHFCFYVRCIYIECLSVQAFHLTGKRQQTLKQCKILSNVVLVFLNLWSVRMELKPLFVNKCPTKHHPIKCCSVYKNRCGEQRRRRTGVGKNIPKRVNCQHTPQAYRK